ncbi:unnamed protein product [Amoebophrya sp. A120]|nr:unnamed protein product [Amoebophrya sp. A120]|eukprot:GSA120T00005833001.1
MMLTNKHCSSTPDRRPGHVESCDAIDVIVKPGDVLYIPKHWWHYVESLTTSASLSFFQHRNLSGYDVAPPASDEKKP